MNPSEAVIELRRRRGESQQAFATAAGLSIRAIANYEAGRNPRGAELGRFLDIAIRAKHTDLTEVFARAMAAELKMKAERIPRSLEESLLADLLFLSMRNRHDPAILQRYEQAQSLLVENFHLLTEKLLKRGERVLGLNREDARRLKAEVRTLAEEFRTMAREQHDAAVRRAQNGGKE